MLLEAWQEFEYEYGDEGSRNAVVNLMPRRVKKRRRIQTQDGVCDNILRLDAKFCALQCFFLFFFFRPMLVGKSISTTFSPRMKLLNPILSSWLWPKLGKWQKNPLHQTRKRNYPKAMLHWLTLCYHQCPCPQSPTIAMIRVNHLVVNLKIRISYYWNRKYTF